MIRRGGEPVGCRGNGQDPGVEAAACYPKDGTVCRGEVERMAIATRTEVVRYLSFGTTKALLLPAASDACWKGATIPAPV